MTIIAIEFESPTLNKEGQVIARTCHTAQQSIEDLGNGITLEMILVPSGIFKMGSFPHHGNLDEQPLHLVTIKSFMMGKFLITQGQWKTVMGKLPPCRFKGNNLPVDRVSWNEAQKFCQRLSKVTKRDYRLPSESQWEYACRAGTSTPFSFGETLTNEVANFNGEHTFGDEPRGFYFHSTNEGGKFPPNAFGIYDMHGNLWEWCIDTWQDDYTAAPRDGDPYQEQSRSHRVARGGSWHEPPALCRSATRLRALQTDADEVMGLRVICDIS